MMTKNKTILITGGAKRIGQEIAKTMHQAGYNIMVHYRSSAGLASELVASFNNLRENSAASVQADMLDINSIPKVIDKTLETFGQLDCLINNASTFYPTPIQLINEQYWDDLIGSNLKAPTFLVKEAMPHLKKQQGCIINIVDIYAERPLKNHPIYCAAKAGLQSLTKSLAYDLAPAIRVNAVAPGAILWPENTMSDKVQKKLLKRIPLKRVGEPEDIAKTVKFLINDAPYITGQIITVDGGRSVLP